MPEATESLSSPRRLDTVTGLRFVAAMLVVIQHSIFEYTHLPVVGAYAGVGSIGVVFFFLLSGFILTWTARIGDRARWFYRRRFARIYPLYAVTALAALFLADYLDQPHQLGLVMSVFLLVQAWATDTQVTFGLDGPMWSLSAEAFFYSLFPLLLPVLRGRTDRQRAMLCVMIWLGMLALGEVILAVGATQGVKIVLVFPPYRLGEFAMGICLGLAVRGGLRVRWRLSVVMGAGAALYVATVTVAKVAQLLGHPGLQSTVVTTWVMAPACAAVIVTAASYDLGSKSSLFNTLLFIRLGQWSFALYLTHLLVIRVVSHTAWLVPHALGTRMLAEVVIILLCVAVSAVAYICVEEPCERILKGPGQRAVPR